MPQQLTFNLSEYRTAPESKVFSGRPRGEWVRGQMELSRHDRDGDVVTVTIPHDTYSVNMSFFLGLFAVSIRFFGKDKFYEHYKFVGDRVHLDEIPDYVDQALKESFALPEKKRA
jgi:hypothetical protein